VTDVVEAVNVAEEAPAAMDTVPGTMSVVRLLDSATVVAAAAGALRETVQVLDALLDIEAGVHESDVSWPDTVKFNVVLSEAPFKVAVMDAEPPTPTEPTVAVKLVELCPVAIMTEAGTETLELLLEIVIVVALVAGADRTTAQLEIPGAATVAGEQEIPLSTAVIVRLTEVDTVAPFQLALTDTDEADVSVPVVAAKLADDCPAGIVTLAGTASAALLLLRDTCAAVVAGLFNETTQLLEALLDSVDGLQEIEISWVGAL